jgi:hypothetical protein
MLIDKFPKIEVNPEERIEKSAQIANYLIHKQQLGPQSEEFQECDLDAALRDERTICMDVDGINIPMLIPIDKLNDFKLDYIEERILCQYMSSC